MRRAQSGTRLPQRVVSFTVPAILDGDSAIVAAPADAEFIGIDAVQASFVTAPETNLGIVAAWVSNAATGVVSVKFSALTGNVTGAAFNVLLTGLELQGLP